MAFYVVAAIVLNLIVTNHLISTTDNHLADRIEDARQQTLALPRSSTPDEDTDVDDAPVFLWSIAPSGTVTALTSTAPPLPERHWGPDPVTLDIGRSAFRFDTLSSHDALLVAAQSTAATSNVQSTLLVAELVFGVILAVAVFAGATVVGLRASAPSELVRRRQAEFTADASHELRTPISVIEAEVGLALDRPRDPTAYRDVLERVGRESTRLRQIVEDLLWLARADSEQTGPGDADLADVGEVVERCVERFGALAAAHGNDLFMQRVGNGPFTVQAQPDLIDRLAGVLVENACKFAGQDGRVEVSVRDTGTRVDLPRRRLRSRYSRRSAGRRLRPVPPGHEQRGGHRPRTGHRRLGRPRHAGSVGDRCCRTGRRAPRGLRERHRGAKESPTRPMKLLASP